MKCSHCSKRAIVDIRYAGRQYCKDHFCRLVWRKFKKNMNNNKLIARGQKVGIALSGGKDSAVCLNLISKFRTPLKLQVYAITVDEGIKEKRRGIKIAQKLCEDLGVEHRIVGFKQAYGMSLDQMVKKIEKYVPCYFCGVLRRSLLNKTAKQMGLDVLATGHNLDDEAQGILMNFMRGHSERLFRIGPRVGIKRYGGFVQRIKPLRMIPEREVALYAMVEGIPFDSGNDCPYVGDSFRDSVRNHLNLLEEQFPGTKIAIVSTFDQFMEEINKEQPKPAICRSCGELTSGEMCKSCEILNMLK